MSTKPENESVQDTNSNAEEIAGKLAAIDMVQATIEFEMDGTIITANDNFLGCLGYTLDEVQGKHHSMFVDEAFKASSEYKEFWQKLNRGEYETAEYKRIGKGGKEVWIQASYNPILDQKGKPFKVVKFATDVTEQKLRNAEFKGQLEAIGKAQAVIEFEMDGTIITANDNFLNVLGYTLGEIQGQHHRMFAEPEFAQSAEYRQFWEKLNRGEYEAAEYKRLGKGGKEVWIQASYNPIMDLNGKPFKVIKFATDITQQTVMNTLFQDGLGTLIEASKNGDLTLRGDTDSLDETYGPLMGGINEILDAVLVPITEAARLNSAVEGSATASMSIDLDLNITYANPATVSLVTENLDEFQKAFPGVDFHDLIGVCVDIFHANPSHQRSILSNPKNLPHQADIGIGNLEFALNISAMFDNNGQHIGANLEWQNVTTLRAQEDAAARLTSSVEGSATPSMSVDRDLILTYMNPATENLIKSNVDTFQTAFPGVDFENALGVCIDVFHTDPALQRRILSDPNNLPHQADIQIGESTFALNISAMKDATGEYIGANLEWQDVTAVRAAASRAESLFSLIEGASSLFMTCDTDLVINYMNPSLQEMLLKHERAIREALPNFDARNLIGTCIDDFHVNPGHQRRLLADVRSLPATVEIKVGTLEFEVTATALYDDQGNHIGNGAEWADLNDRAVYREEVGGLIEASRTGDLSKRGDLSVLSEVYVPMMEGINEIVDAIVAPINEASEVLEQVANQDLTVRVLGDYEGDHAKIKNNLNSALSNLESAMGQAIEASNQVTAASSQIADGSQSLAQGASEQASSLEQISASLEELTAMTTQNADNASSANGLAQDAQAVAQTGTEAMTRMSEAINLIKSSAEQTSKIIKTIDEIAFQTNLLALNAAVEAARAGDAGKGFAVVAEEVRSLAARSAQAAKNTADLIEESGKNADGGVRISEEVATTLAEIVDRTEKVGGLVAEIAAASKEQASGLSQINDGVTQMDSVTQKNAANSEESAAAAEELNAQASGLANMVGQFRIASSGHGHIQIEHQSAPMQQLPPSNGNGNGGAPAPAPQPAHASSSKEIRPEQVIPLDDSDLAGF